MHISAQKIIDCYLIDKDLLKKIDNLFEMINQFLIMSRFYFAGLDFNFWTPFKAKPC